MKKILSDLYWIAKIALGCAVFALGMDLFLFSKDLTAGGVSGIALIITHLLGFGTVGTITAMINLPLFLIGGKKIGIRFFVGSLFGTVFLSFFIDLFALVPPIDAEPLLSALYGGALCGLGAGIVFMNQASTGGSDIVVRLLKRKYRHMPLGSISICLDFVVATVTGIVFQDVSKTLYSLIAIFVTGKVIDAVIYRFDYSKVALIVSSQHEQIAEGIASQINRGVTYLYGQGYYSHDDTKVIMTAVKKNELNDLMALVVQIDPEAFIIVQEAHQVLGKRFAQYSDNSL